MTKADLEDIRRMVREAEAKAREMAKQYTDRRDRGDIERIQAETAEIIIQYAEKSADLIKAEDFAAMKDQNWRFFLERTLEFIAAEPAKGRRLRDRALAELDQRDLCVSAYLEENALDAWSQCQVNLASLGGRTARVATP